MTMMAQPDPETEQRVARVLDDQREQFHRELMRRSMRITELELELDEQRGRYESSLSWRLTRPLRFRSYLRQRRDAATGG
jgi:hypothetical protein